MNECELYQRLVSIIDVPVIETEQIWTKGIFISKRGAEPTIYIKTGLDSLDKLKVLLHEYIHYIHMTKFFEQENRAESELIAESSVFFILRIFGIETLEEPILAQSELSMDRVKLLSAKIQQICNEITQKLR